VVTATDADETEAAPGEPGELVMRGPQFMLGYWKQSRSHCSRAARRMVLVRRTSSPATPTIFISWSIAAKK